jgi:hypothetical protein
VIDKRPRVGYSDGEFSLLGDLWCAAIVRPKKVKVDDVGVTSRVEIPRKGQGDRAVHA